MSDFLEMIQSSEEEIYSYLNYIEAYKIEGEYFFLMLNIFLKYLNRNITFRLLEIVRLSILFRAF